MIASLSAAIPKSPRTFTDVTFGRGGTVKNSPGAKAYTRAVRNIRNSQYPVAVVVEKTKTYLFTDLMLIFQIQHL